MTVSLTVLLRLVIIVYTSSKFYSIKTTIWIDEKLVLFVILLNSATH